MASEVDTAEVLISEIQARPALWNSKLASYKNKNLRNRLYAEVAEILGTTKTTVAAQWKNKKDKYRRELKKVPVLHSGDAAEHYKSNWPYFEIMSFLKDLLTPAVKFGNLPFDGHSQKDISSDIEGDDEADTRSDIDAPISPPSLSASNTPVREERQSSASCSSPISHKQGKGNRKRLCDVRDEKFIDIEKKKLHLLAQHLKNDANEPENEELNFFKSLIPYMNKFNPIQKLKVRNNIQQLILDELLSAEKRESNIHQQTSARNNNMILLSSQNSTPHEFTASSNISTPISSFSNQYPFQY